MFSAPHQATLIVCIALGVLTAGLVAAPAVAGAQQTPENNTTATVPTTSQDVGRNVTIEVDQNTHVTNYQHRDGEMVVTLVTEAPVTRVTLSESIGGDVAGSGYFSVRQVTLTRGEPTTVTVPARKVDGKAVVTLTTSACISAGKCPYLQAGSGGGLLFTESIDWGLGYLIFIIGSIGTAYGTKRYRERQDTAKGDKVARRTDR